MQQILAFASTAVTCALLVTVMEFLLPAGALKNTASAAAGMVYLSAVCDQILGIITRMGV